MYGLVGTVCQSSIFLVGVLGNLMVVVTVRGTKSLHTTTNCYLVSLALADLITLLSSVPQEVLSYHILGRSEVTSPGIGVSQSLGRRQVVVGQTRLLPDGLLPVPGNECLSPLPDSLHCGEIHCHLSSHEGPGTH